MEILRKLLGLKPKRYVYRSSVTGKFVSKAFALANPNETVRERA